MTNIVNVTIDSATGVCTLAGTSFDSQADFLRYADAAGIPADAVRFDYAPFSPAVRAARPVEKIIDDAPSVRAWLSDLVIPFRVLPCGLAVRLTVAEANAYDAGLL